MVLKHNNEKAMAAWKYLGVGSNWTPNRDDTWIPEVGWNSSREEKKIFLETGTWAEFSG